MAAQISLLILTSPGRETYLQACLQALQAQYWQDFELIIADDGSSGCHQVVKSQCVGWKNPVYLWRPNDYCLSRSYNLGVEAASGNFLVFLNADILLNPLALTSYAASFKHLPQSVIYGYFGSVKEDLRGSVLIPGRQVNLRDERFDFGPDGGLRCQPQMLEFPQHFAWGGNWGLAKTVFQDCGGMNEAYTGWGLEDVDFANRVLGRHGHLVFSLDVWGEHQAHAMTSDQQQLARNREKLGTYWIAVEPPGLIFDKEHNPLRQLLSSG